MDNSMKQVLEGQLSKYTNVMKGWQYRWFVLNPETGTLSYYMVDEQKSSRARGSIHLAGAVVSPSDEDSNTFSVNSASGELFRLRATNARQRQQWVDRLRLVTEMFNRVQAESGTPPPRGEESQSPRQYEAPLSVLSSLHDASGALQQTATAHGTLTEAVRRLPAHVSEDVQTTSTDPELLLLLATSQATLLCLEQCYTVLQQQRSAAALPIGAPLPAGDRAGVRLAATRHRPEKDFLSDVADWFDTTFSTSKAQRKPSFTSHAAVARPAPPPPPAADSQTADASGAAWPTNDDDEEEEEGAPPPAPRPSADASATLRPLLATLKLGADLTRLRLPAALLDTCSLLEVYSQLCCRPLLFARIGAAETGSERMSRLLEWYLAALGAGCPRSRKPYNPVLGEVFVCSWPLEAGGRVRFLAEQVSHHPPVTAMCVSCSEPEMSLQATLGCRAQYINSASISLTGEATLHIAARAETYAFNYPALYIRSLLNDRWVELGGQVKVSCQQTGYSAALTFHTKPMSDSGERHRVTGEVRSADGKVTARLAGNWQTEVVVTHTEGATETVQCDAAGARRWIRPPARQAAHESRRVWEAVTTALTAGDYSAADQHKDALEAAQRRRAGQGHTARHFYQHEQNWVFRPSAP